MSTAMRVPIWLTLGVAAFVIAFGAHRIRLAFRSTEEQARAKAKGGMYGLSKRTHLIVGTVYLLLGGALVATSFGWNPIAGLWGVKTTTVQPSAAPSSKSIQVTSPPAK